MQRYKIYTKLTIPNEYYAYLVSEYSSEKEKKQIDDYVESSLHNLSIEIGQSVDEIGIKIQQMKIY